MSVYDRPKRTRRAPERYEPEEIPNDDYDDDYDVATGEEEETLKRFKGEFDGGDDDEDEDEDSALDEYDENDGFAVPDDQVSEDVDYDEEEDLEDSADFQDDDDEEEVSVEYDDQEDEPDVVDAAIAYQTASTLADEAAAYDDSDE